MNMTSLTLLWLAGYSTVTSIVVIILCFLAMTIFIGLVSTNWDYSERTNTVTGVEQRNMVQVCNPFFIKLGQNNKKLTDGITVHLSSLCPSKLFVLWGVKINPLHDFILKPGLHIVSALQDPQSQDWMALEALHHDILQFPVAGDHIVSLTCPKSINSDTLGTMPRKRYPVTIFSLLSESWDTSHESEEQTGSVDKQSIICLISLIHLQDDMVVQPSHIIGQYVKASGIQLYSLQPLFLSSSFDGCHGNQGETLNSKNECNEEATQPCRPTEKDQTTSTNSSRDSKADNVDPKSMDTTDSTETVRAQKNSSQDSSTLDRAESVRRRSANGPHENVSTSTHGKGISEQPLEEIPLLRNEDTTITRPECVVCQTRQVVCALLPCRHACVCLGCFKLLDRCPMCRGALESYFLLGDKEDEDIEEESSLHDLQQGAVNERFTQVWQRLNERLNAFFGIR